MDSGKVVEILEKIKTVKIAVYGDLCLDAYWILDPSGGEVSVETGKQTQVAKRHYYSLGGASNIIANVSALKPKYIKAIGVIGSDIFGTELKRKLQIINVDTDSIVIQEDNFDTMTYVKRYINENEEPRVDFGFFNRRSERTNNTLISHIENALQECDVMIFNQQVQGSLDEEFIIKVNDLFNRYKNKIVIFDSRHYGNRFWNVYRKANRKEVAELAEASEEISEEITFNKLEQYAKGLFVKADKPVFITCGPDGIMVYDNYGMHYIPGIQLLKKLDTVGAGDTVTSALALSLGAGVEPREASEFANFAGTVTVQKLFQTGTASPEEIIEVCQDPDYYHNPELSRDIRLTKYLPDSEIEICNKSIPDFKYTEHIVFDHDGTISTLRQGWEQIMEPVMVRAILGDNYQNAPMNLYNKVLDRVKNYIDKSTGIETLIQMQALVEMVKEFDVVPGDQILDKFGYKEIYNASLMSMVNKRIAKFTKGDLGLEDFTLKGSIPFLKALNRKGVKLYLVSGTDEMDVLKEAEVLGYSSLFTGGIYGALNESKISTKKKVIQRIIKENNLIGGKVAAIGDGPVEIREAIKVNGIAVGVASDEIRRHGLNHMKRARLIKAGAHIIIPDFSDRDSLWNLFGCTN